MRELQRMYPNSGNKQKDVDNNEAGIVRSDYRGATGKRLALQRVENNRLSGAYLGGCFLLHKLMNPFITSAKPAMAMISANSSIYVTIRIALLSEGQERPRIES